MELNSYLRVILDLSYELGFRGSNLNFQIFRSLGNCEGSA
jgi:hypothetical protein